MTDLFRQKPERRVGKGLIPGKVNEGHILVRHNPTTTQEATAGAGLITKALGGVTAEAGAHIQKTIQRTQTGRGLLVSRVINLGLLPPYSPTQP